MSQSERKQMKEAALEIAKRDLSVALAEKKEMEYKFGGKRDPWYAHNVDMKRREVARIKSW